MIAFVLCVSLIKINLKQEDSSVDLNDGVVKANLLKKASLHNPALKYHLMVFSIFKFRHCEAYRRIITKFAFSYHFEIPSPLIRHFTISALFNYNNMLNF